MNELQKKLLDTVRYDLCSESNLNDKLIDETVDDYSEMKKFSTLLPEQIEEVRNIIKSDYSIKLYKGDLIEDAEEGHEKWFLARKSNIEMRYWERYTQYLLKDKNFPYSVVSSMDDILDTLTDLLGDPQSKFNFNRHGLIIGDVQSGKTANYTGLICKAVDSGYKVVVLLTSSVEKLRKQTQERIDEGFVGRNSQYLLNKKNSIKIGVGKYDIDGIHPACLTSTVSDFCQSNATNLGLDLRNINGAVIFVLKKNSTVLENLNNWLVDYNLGENGKIDSSILVIDDEADNASVNTKDKDKNPSAINGKIRRLLGFFSKSSYVGYTATPYANIFIDPDSYDEMCKQDLFPRDYIYSLNSPSNYIGARDIFSEDGDAKGMLMLINDEKSDPESIESILPLCHKSSFCIEANDIPEDLKTAIETFVLANVIQDIEVERNRRNTHRSMLINVSRFTDVQIQISSFVENYLNKIKSATRTYGQLSWDFAKNDTILARLHKTYTDVYPYVETPWPEIQKNLYFSCKGIIVKTINRKVNSDFDFYMYKNEGLRMIAVGGMSLSRGLTLEGLVVSYLYRNSTMYDTLMQMGRWFGYREGYSDLCKIWMSDMSMDWYRHISEATDELRRSIKRYENTGLTPLDFGLRVRSDINSLLVTARNKMRGATTQEILISLSGVAIQTTDLYSDMTINNKNIKAVKDLVARLYKARIQPTVEGSKITKYGFKNVPSSYVLDLLDTVEIPPNTQGFVLDSITQFVNNYKGKELENWDISFAMGKSEDCIDILGDKYSFHHPKRKFIIKNNGRVIEFGGTMKNGAFCRALSSPADGKFGCSELGVSLAMQNAKCRAGERNKNVSEKKTLTYKLTDFFIPGIKRNPLLTIYFVGLKDIAKDKDLEENKKFVERNINSVYVGFVVGIPTLQDQQTKCARYVLNKVAQDMLYENEGIYFSDEEDDDKDIDD